MTRTLEDLKPVLQDQNSQGPSPVYSVEPAKVESWVNKTTIQPGKIGEEYTKTFGHYHTAKAEPELYRVESGEGILVLQKKHIEVGEWIPEKVDQVLLIRAKAGDQILITPEYGHSWSNVGSSPLVLLDNWAYNHSDEDYAFIAKHRGMAYYLTDNGEAPTPVRNENYVDTPEPIWATSQQLPQA